MRRCPRCEAFVPLRARLVGEPDLCPECGLRVPSATLRALRNVAAGAGAVITLMACYGAAYPMYASPGEPEPCGGNDRDGDGVCADVDCDDTDPQVGACQQSAGEESEADLGEASPQDDLEE